MVMGFITTKVKEAARFMLYFSPGSESIINRIDPTFHRNESCPFNPKISNYEAAKMCLYRNPHFDRTLSPVALYNMMKAKTCANVHTLIPIQQILHEKRQRAHTLFLQLSTSQQINPPMTHCSKCCNYKVPSITYC